MRNLDKKDRHSIHEMCLEFVRAKHNVTETEFVPKASRKHKRANKAKVALEPLVNLEDFEAEDDFSIGSEISSGEPK